MDFPLDCDTVGRLPWRDPRLDIADPASPLNPLLDASGETLWYAVSDAFDNEAGGVVNSDTLGTITLVDRSGSVIYDGAVAGIAAVVIAPGPIVRRDMDNNGTFETPQLRNTVAQRIDPRNYLDSTADGFDNSVFNNGESDTNDDGFILGPVFDINEGEIVVNDQVIIVTAEEVIAMAEKKVLETYRDALDLYRVNVPPDASFHGYPWLHGYDDTADLDLYDVPTGKTVGRVPFMNYFLDHDSLHDIVTDLQISFDVSLNYTSMQDVNDPFDTTYIDVFNDLFAGFPAGTQTLDISRARVSFSKARFDGSDDDNSDDVGTLVVETAPAGTGVNSAPSSTLKRYFWDGCPTCFEAADGWEPCPVIGAPDGTDCALDAAGTAFEPFTDWAVHADVRIRMVELRVSMDPEFAIELEYSPAPAVTYDSFPTGAAHARFTTSFAATEVNDLSVADAAETNARNFFDLEVVACDQDNEVMNNLNLAELGNANSGTIDCTVVAPVLDLVTVAGHAFNVLSTVDISVDYYPELPLWIAENDWDNAVMMSYAAQFRPAGTGNCTPEDGDTATGASDDCLVVSNLGGVNNRVVSLLTLAGEHDLLDGDDLNDDGDYVDAGEVAPDGDFINDLYDVFEWENYSGIGPYPVPSNDPDAASDTGLELVFDKREDVDTGNSADILFVFEQL